MDDAPLAIVVNSCFKYHQKTLPLVLESLQGRFDGDVYFVVGESETDEMYLPMVYRRWANVDNNGLIWVVQDDAKKLFQEKGYEWIFYIHDTCLVDGDPDSLSKTLEKYATDACSAMKIHPQTSMSMGYYRLKNLWEPVVTDFLNSSKNFDIGRVKDVKRQVEDQIFRKLSGEVIVLPSECRTDAHVDNVYGTDTKRIVEYYSVPKLKKYKANYQGTFECLNL